MCDTLSTNKTTAADLTHIIKARSAFTLLEVLIALTLLSLLGAALFTSYFSVVKVRDRIADGMEERRELGTTFDLIRREIASCLYAKSDNRLRFVVEDRDIFGKPASNLELTTLVANHNVGNIRISGVSAVRYETIERDGSVILARREQDLFYDWQAARPYPQMERINSFLVECYDGSKWLRSWDTALNGALPKLVRVTVSFVENGNKTEFSVLSAPRIAEP